MVAGSIRRIFNAGTTLAIVATASSVAMTVAKVTGSVVDTPQT